MKKIILITGVNRGIGLALTKKFLSEDFIVFGTSRSEIVEEVSHPNFYSVVLDVTLPESISKSVFTIKEKFQKIDLLINSAGVGLDLNDETPEIDIIKATFETNVFGLINFTETIKDCIIDGGTIFNISSAMGMLNRDKIVPNATAYRMSKSALNMYTKTLSARLSERNIKVVSIHPGWVKTDMGGQEADITPEFSANGIYQLYIKNVPTNSFWAADTETQLNW